MSKIYYSITIIFSLFIIASCGPEIPTSESNTLYQITITVEPEEAGSVSPTLVEAGESDEIEISATPNENWIFDSWQGDHNGSSNPTKITVTGDKNITAVFVVREFNLNITIEGEGTVFEQVVDEENQTIQLTANPADGWRFVEWQGDVTGTDNPVELTMDEAKEVTAVFEPDDNNGDDGEGDSGDDGDNGGNDDEGTVYFNLSTTSEGEGVISPGSGEFEEGTDVELEATADEGWSFSHWDGDLSGSTNPETITMDSDKDVTAIFEEIIFYELSTDTDGSGSGSVSPDSGDYEEGTEVELRATPDDESFFSHWEGDLSGSANPQTITMDSDKDVIAVFEEIIFYELSTDTDGSGSGSVSPDSGDYEEGTEVELRATPDDESFFSHWEGDLRGSTNPQTIIMDSDKDVTAVFEDESELFDLTIAIEGEGFVEIILRRGNEVNGLYQRGATVVVRAIPEDGWSFYTWEGDLSGKANPRTINMNSDKIVTAVFEEEDDDDDDDD